MDNNNFCFLQKKTIKKVIDKAIKYINSKRYDWGDFESQDEEDYDIGYDEIIELLDILKEVSK